MLTHSYTNKRVDFSYKSKLDPCVHSAIGNAPRQDFRCAKKVCNRTVIYGFIYRYSTMDQGGRVGWGGGGVKGMGDS